MSFVACNMVDLLLLFIDDPSNVRLANNMIQKFLSFMSILWNKHFTQRVVFYQSNMHLKKDICFIRKSQSDPSHRQATWLLLRITYNSWQFSICNSLESWSFKCSLKVFGLKQILTLRSKESLMETKLDA